MPKSADKLFLLHPTRWRIYKIICESPGTYFYKLMSELPKYSDKVSSATLIYHLKKLNEAQLLETAKMDGKRIYFPKELRDMEAERAYMLLKNDNAMKIFQYILEHPPFTVFQNQIARELNVHHDSIYHHVKRLNDAGLIEKKKKGKFTCFAIGTIGNDLLEGSLNIITEQYIQYILSNLQDSCHFPEVIEKKANSLVIRVVCPNEDDIELTINLSDFKLIDFFTSPVDEN